jgi:hypothetical protein
VFTAVQLRTADGLSCRLLYGVPTATTTGMLGPIALFPPGRVVAYVLERRRHSHVYVFRTEYVRR